jgi:predicted Zn-dependent protease
MIAFLLACLLTLVIALTPLGRATAEINLPDLGDASSASLGELEERRLGRQLMARVRRNLKLIDDLEITSYIDQLGHRLVVNSAEPTRHFQWFIVEDSTLNAFAAPGGYIGIHSGLISAAETQSELAAVLAHEISHATQNHLARLIARSKEVSLPAAGAMIASILLGGQVGTAALLATNAAVLEDRLSYSRDFEREADALGIKTLSAAGFDPRGMTQFFSRMERWARVQELDVPEFLRTHPLTTARIAEAESRLARYPERSIQSDTPYRLMRARLRALYDDNPKDTLAYFTQQSLDTPTGIEYAIAKYGEALTQMRLREFEPATKTLAQLSREYPDLVAFAYALTDNFAAAGDYNAALATVEKTSVTSSAVTSGNEEANARIWSLKKAELLIDAGRVGQAYAITKASLRERNNDQALYELHARAAAKSGDMIASHEAMAEYHFLNDDYKAALDQLFTAKQAAKDDFHTASRIDARIAVIQNEQTLLNPK